MSDMSIAAAVTTHKLEQLESDRRTLTERLSRHVADLGKKEDALTAANQQLLEAKKQATAADCVRLELDSELARLRTALTDQVRAIVWQLRLLRCAAVNPPFALQAPVVSAALRGHRFWGGRPWAQAHFLVQTACFRIVAGGWGWLDRFRCQSSQTTDRRGGKGGRVACTGQAPPLPPRDAHAS